METRERFVLRTFVLQKLWTLFHTEFFEVSVREATTSQSVSQLVNSQSKHISVLFAELESFHVTSSSVHH